jgi:hypothetical protein
MHGRQTTGIFNFIYYRDIKFYFKINEYKILIKMRFIFKIKIKNNIIIYLILTH